MRIDLQLHSTYSDGYYSPTQLADFIVKKGVKIASLTDHNTISGLDEFKNECKKNKIKFIPGLELYVKLNGRKFNILWYNFNCSDPDLHMLLRETQIRRRARVRHILERLVKLDGFKLDIDKIIDSYNHYVPINHVIDDLLKNIYNRKIISKIIGRSDFREGDIIHEFFRSERYGYLRESYVDVKRVIRIRKKVGGQLIYNHPGKYGKIKEDFVAKLKDLGFDGIELLSPHHSLGAIMYIQFLAKKLNLITTGGSDFHKPEGSYSSLQNSWDYFKIDSEYLRKINRIIK